MKNCTKCAEEKSLSEFPKNKGMKDGHLNTCKICTSIYIKAYGKKNRKKLSAKHKVWRNDNPECFRKSQRESKKRNRSKILISQKRWRESNGHKSRAHDLLNKAVKRGDLVKPTLCEKCHDAHRHIHGHHEDYEKPLEVIWLCPPCHHNRHEELLNDSKN